jgi:hypothetical protein
MTESSEQQAPELGTPTDSAVGDASLDASNQSGDAGADETTDTPDELGGTGSEQAGGAG